MIMDSQAISGTATPEDALADIESEFKDEMEKAGIE